YQGTDDFTLEYQGIWPVTFYDDTWNPVVSTGPMIPSEIKTFYLNVSIPGAAVSGDMDNALIWSNSTLDPLEWISASIVTSVPYDTDPPWVDPITLPLPGWSNSLGIGTNSEWHLTNNNPYSAPQCWYYGQEAIWQYDPGPNDGQLYTPYLYLPAGSYVAQMDVWHWYDWETLWDGGVVDISTDNGSTWTRLTPQDGYDGMLASGYGCALEGQNAFTGNSGGYVNDAFDLSSYIGSVIKLKFWAGVDSWFAGQEGWYVDDITVTCPAYGAQWIPASLSAFGDAGDIMSYDMTLRNIGKFTDTFTFTTTTTLGWPVAIYNQTWAVVADSGAIDPGASKLFHANVTIPAAALLSDTETTVITATSTGNPSATTDCGLTTFVRDEILVVDDDGGIAPDTRIYYTTALDNLGYGYDLLEVAINGKPGLADLQAH
ncbi:MAG: immune inhibitor A, partial [Thermoplasmata archaeon]|nr:immune inhibitor A [Thermoplasmata archaeon]